MRKIATIPARYREALFRNTAANTTINTTKDWIISEVYNCKLNVR